MIIPLYNKSKSILNTVDTVLAQTYTNFEVIVINDGSTDNSLDIIMEIKDDRVRVINQKNGGVSSARNKGIFEAKREWVVFIDADDVWMSDHLLVLKQLIEKYSLYSVYCTSYLKVVDADATLKKEVLDTEHRVIFYDADLYFKEAIKSKPLWTGVVAVNKKAIIENNIYFDERLNRGEDLDYWAKLAKLYTIVKYSKVTALYVDEPDSLSKGLSDYSSSIVSKVRIKGLLGYERQYFRRMLLSRIKLCMLHFKFKEAIYLLCKHNYQLLR